MTSLMMDAMLAFILDVTENLDLSQWSKREPSLFWTLPKSNTYTRSASHFHLLSKKRVFLLDGFVSSVVVLEKVDFIIILRSKIFNYLLNWKRLPKESDICCVSNMNNSI